ncbi:DUF7504 family protein [Salinigranum sp. GCM10025319]|uniref:DUF7504 family protein n=1 Tax=Salinigranum sp. GCM10025319 TaxID=3252687 RepID=UPI003620C4E3
MSVDSGARTGGEEAYYEFTSGIPLRPMPSGTTLVVRGDPSGALDELAMRLLSPVPHDQGGTVLVDTDDPTRRTAARWAETTDTPVSRLGVVSCHGGRDDPPTSLGATTCVARPNDLTGLGIQYSKLVHSFVDSPRGRLRVGLDSVSTLLMYCDDVQTVYRFLHTFTGRIRSTGQLGVFVVNPEMHDDRVLNVVTQPFDGVVDVRRTDDGRGELRVSGLADQPESWTSF